MTAPTSSRPTSASSAAASPAPAPTPAATPDDVSLVVVTKFFPASDVRLLADLGVTDVGENRHQEAEAKAAECADLGLRWHFIGGLQSNKAAAVAAYADVVESVDRAKLVGAARPGRARARARLDVLLQVSLDPPGGRRPVGRGPRRPRRRSPARWRRPSGLRLRGLMAVAPLGEDPAAAFGRLAGHPPRPRRPPPRRHLAVGRDERRPRGGDPAGATHVRVGSAILGPRPPVK